VVGGKPVAGSFTLNAMVGLGGAVVRIQSSDNSVATVSPAIFHLSAGVSGGTFEVVTSPVPLADSPRYCTISAVQVGPAGIPAAPLTVIWGP
jgi:hypothetical protein